MPAASTQNPRSETLAAAHWLSAEISSLAHDVGLDAADAAALEKLVAKLAETTLGDRETHLRVAPAGTDAAFLEKISAAGEPASALAGTPESFAAGTRTPLIFDAENSALYFFRHYRQEVESAEKLHALADGNGDGGAGISAAAEKIIESRTPFPLNEAQKRAVRRILSSRLTVVSGGPGTGKTTLLLRALLCVLTENPEAKIVLAAPTGKAAARMAESVARQAEAILRAEATADAFPREALRRTLALEAASLHRALRVGADPAKTLPVPALDADCVVADEASMIDQSLMHRLLAALPAHAKLVLLGDKNQLDSVGPGHVFSAICGEDSLRGARVELTESRRFSATGTLGRLADAVVRGDAETALRIVDEAAAAVGTASGADGVPAGTFFFQETPPGASPNADELLLDLFPEKLRRVPADADPREILELVESARLLTPLRAGGAFCTEKVNARARRLFAPAGTPPREHFHGEPVIITRNAPRERLSNGEVGVVLADPSDGRLLAWFRDADGVRALPVSLLPEHESAYAMSVHKAQGSEFSRLTVVLPAVAGTRRELFSRQLLYTAITRFLESGGNAGGSRFSLIFDRETLRETVLRSAPQRSLLFARRAQTP